MVAPNDAALEAPRRALDRRPMVGLVAVIGAGDSRCGIDVEPPPGAQHRAPVDRSDAHGHEHHAEPSEESRRPGAGALCKSDEKPAVFPLKLRNRKCPTIAHHLFY